MKWDGATDEQTLMPVQSVARVGCELGKWVLPTEFDASDAPPNPSGGAELSSPVVGEHHTTLAPRVGAFALLLTGQTRMGFN